MIRNPDYFLDSCRHLLASSSNNSAVLPPELAWDWLCRRLDENPYLICANGHVWTFDNSRVRVRYRDGGRGLSVERDCLDCKTISKRNSRRY